MVVITLEKCPLSLCGDLTKWLQEISSGVYVGQVSARVRDELWRRVCDESKSGRATMVFSAHNDQHLNYRAHNTTWEPIDFDGIKLMMRPSPARVKALGNKRLGWSRASQYSKAKGRRRSGGLTAPEEYVVFDIETTGFDVDKDQIIEIGAVKVQASEPEEHFHVLVRIEQSLPEEIVELTGITDEVLASEGISLEEAIEGFLEFVDDYVVVAHRASFDCEFVQVACEECELDDFDNEAFDTIDLAKRVLPDVPNYRLGTLLSLLNLENEIPHRAKSDADATLRLYRKLIEM